MKMFVAALLLLFVFRQNNPPIVKILSPKPNETFATVSPVRYSVNVSDKEDGDTKFDEINANEILLTVKTNGSKAGDKNAIHAMMSSNCMNCHAFNSKLIGPSFIDISTKKSNKPDLVKHVKDGSTGIWGPAVMPSHPELSNDEIEKMISWILKFKDEKNTEYYLGKEGTVKLQKPSKVTFTASYLDHGKVMGEDVVSINIK